MAEETPQPSGSIPQGSGETPQPWHRQSGEGAEAYQAFESYLEMGSDRSLVRVGQKWGKSGGLIERWSAKHDWVNRARAYDDHRAERQRRAAEAEHLARITAYRDRAAKIGSATADVALSFLVAAGKRLQRLMMEPNDPRRNGLRDTIDDIPIKALPGFLRAAASIAQVSLTVEAEALGVRELEQRLNDAADQDAEEDSEAGH